MGADQIVYVNGDYKKAKDATISIFDRGFLFADGVYEVSTVLDGNLIDNQAHLTRLQRSLDGLEIPCPISHNEILKVQQTLIEKNKLSQGVVYLQITRGPAPRSFDYPKSTKPSIILFTQEKEIVNLEASKTGIRVISLPDIRWKRRDLKTVSLLAQSMAKHEATMQGVDDVWMIEDGFVTEGSSNNAFIISKGKIITRQLGNEILHGITRKAVLKLAQDKNITIDERPFTIEEAYKADEAFITSASSFVMPVVEIDKHKIGTGKVGPLSTKLRALYIEMAKEFS